MNYLVMETRPSYSIVLDESGRIIKAANTNHVVGQTVTSIMPFHTQKSTGNLRSTMRLAGGLVAAIALIITLYLYQNPPFSYYASVYMTINPEIRMDVDIDGMVGKLKALNEDGATLIQGYPHKNKTMYTVMNELTDAAMTLGMLSEGRTVTVEIDTDDEAWFVKTGTAASESLNRHLAKAMAVTIRVSPYASDTPRDFALPTPTATGTPAPSEEISSPSYDDDDDDDDNDADDDDDDDDIDDDDDDDTDVDDDDDDTDVDDDDDDDTDVDDDDDDDTDVDDDDDDTDIDDDDDDTAVDDDDDDDIDDEDTNVDDDDTDDDDDTNVDDDDTDEDDDTDVDDDDTDDDEA